MSRDRTLAAALVALALLGSSACGRAPSSVRTGSGGPADTGVEAEADATTATVAVVDHEGAVRGTVVRAELDARDHRILDRLEALGTSSDGVVVPRATTEEQDEALLVLEAVPVHDQAGDLVGHLAGHFLTVGERATLLPWAVGVVDELTAS